MYLFSHFSYAYSCLPSSKRTLDLTYIPTAALGEEADMTEYMAENKKVLASLFHVTELDLAAASAAEVAETLEHTNAVFCEGGNTFWLMHHLRRVHADAIIRRRVHAEELIYLGNSAGSIVAAPDIEYCAGIESPGASELMRGDFTGLGLVPFHPLPHLNNPWFDARVRDVMATWQDRVTLVPITDKQMIYPHKDSYDVATAP